jgi:(p)ppGpp synthase/HD superfamily hydrolase
MKNFQHSEIETTSLYPLAEKARVYACNCHCRTNHLYAHTHQYSFHLQRTVIQAAGFLSLIDSDQHDIVLAGCWCHDLISDARQSFNNIVKEVGLEVAEIVRAVTEDVRGRNRLERMPDYIYQEIRNTRGATFTKLADRIANVLYGKNVSTDKTMYQTYQREYPHFKEMLYTENLQPMFELLETLLKEDSGG